MVATPFSVVGEPVVTPGSPGGRGGPVGSVTLLWPGVRDQLSVPNGAVENRLEDRA